MSNINRKNVILATGLPKMNHVIFDNPDIKNMFEVIETIENRNEIMRVLERTPNADIILISDSLTGDGESLTQLMIDAHLTYPQTRVIYLTSEVSGPQAANRMPQLGYLARTHIYDIVAETPITMRSVVRRLMEPAIKEDVEWVLNYINQEEKSAPKEAVEVLVDEENEANENQRGVLDNLHVFSSIKPGTGKSFIATNIAAAIARFGVVNENGDKPKVALIDGDMQNLSIGTLLQVEDEAKNLRTVIDKIHLIHDEKGLEIDNPHLVKEVKTFIKNAFIPYSRQENLHVLAGSQLQWDKVQDFKHTDFTYLLQTIQNDYDIIIMDSSSSLAHVSTAPMMVMSKQLYYIINLDFNNVRNNSRYHGTLAELGVQDKVKYILNENITPDMITEQDWSEELMFGSNEIRENGFDLIGSIPIIEKTSFLNRIFMGEPIVLDDEDHTLDARIEILKIANQIWEVDNLNYLEEKQSRIKNDGQKGRKRFFGFRS